MPESVYHEQCCWLVVIFRMIVQIFHYYSFELLLFRFYWRFNYWFSASKFCCQDNSVPYPHDESFAELQFGRAMLRIT